MDSQSPQSAQDMPLIDIVGIIGILWRRKLLILACFITTTALAFAYLMVTKPIYTANAVVLIDPREANTTSSPNVLGAIGTDSAAIASQVSIISSTESLRAVFSKLALENDPEFNAPGLLGSFLGGAQNPEAAFGSFRSRLAVEREGLTYIINISFISTEPQKAARIANAIAAQYISGQIAEKTGASTEVTNQLNQSIAQLRQQVTDAETAIQNYRAENNLFDTGTGRTLIDDQVTQLNAQLSTAQQAARDAANRYDQARSVGASASGLDRLSQFLNSGPAEQLRNLYNQRLTELANAEATLGPQHPTRVRLTAEIANLTRQMRDEAARIITELKADSELAAANVQRVQDDLIRLQTQSAMTNQQAVQLRQLERNAEASRQVLEQFLARSEQTSQLDDLQRPDARMVSEATPPLRASWPRRSLVLAAAGLLGIAIGAVLAFATDKKQPVRLSATTDKSEQKTGPQAAKPRKPRRHDRQTVISRDWGHIHTRYAQPNHYLPSADYMSTIHSEAADYPDDAFATGVQSLFDKLADTLPQTAPAIVHLCGFGDRLEANRLAFALAQEAKLAQWTPVIIDMDPLKKPRTTSRYSSATPSATDAPTGLLVVTPSGTNALLDDVELVESAIYDHENQTDVIFIIGKPLTDPATLGTRFQSADKTMIVLSAAESRKLVESVLIKSGIPDAPPLVVTVSHGDNAVQPRFPHRSEEVSRAVADLRHLARRRAG